MSTHRIVKLAAFVATLMPLGAAPRPAFAQTAEAAPAPADQAPRFRFGLSAIAGLVTQQELQTSGGATTSPFKTEISVPGLAMRAGVQLDDHYAVFYQGSLSVFLTTVRNSVLFEVTPVPWFSVGAGVAADYFNDWHCLLGCVQPDEAWSVGVPVRLALNLPVHRAKSGRRLGVSFNVDLTPSYTFGGNNIPSGFQLGSVAGVGFEMF